MLVGTKNQCMLLSILGIGSLDFVHTVSAVLMQTDCPDRYSPCTEICHLTRTWSSSFLARCQPPGPRWSTCNICEFAPCALAVRKCWLVEDCADVVTNTCCFRHQCSFLYEQLFHPKFVVVENNLFPTSSQSAFPSQSLFDMLLASFLISTSSFASACHSSPREQLSLVM